jgi:predicted nucleic acid-binding protein
MRVDVTTFIKLNVIDTCSIWNLLSSDRLYRASIDSSCSFCCTAYVNYESLLKARKQSKASDEALKKRLVKEKKAGQFVSCDISIDDLQDVEILEKRQNLGKGELSSIAFAKKTKQAFLTDDQKARLLSESYIGLENTQTIPQLFGWLLYNNTITDSDKDTIIMQHEALDGTLKKYFDEIYKNALEKRLMQVTTSPVGAE